MTTSYWRQALSTIDCDVLVIGAGICGLSAALQFQRRGLKVRIVERHNIGAGASSRNAGFLMRGAAENYAAAIREYGRERARLIWRWTEENLQGLRDEGIEALPNYQRIPSCLLALTEEERAELDQAQRLLREDGFNVQWLEPGSKANSLDTAWSNGRPLAGLLNPDDGACNPVEVLHHLAGKLDHPVLENQEVIAINLNGAGVTARTASTTVHARRTLLCTNAYLSLLAPGCGELVKPRRGQMLALRVPGRTLKYSYYANHGYEYFRQTTDGTIVVGGCRKQHAHAEVGFEDATTPALQNDLEAFAASILGLGRSSLNITARWSGTMGFSPDGLPLIGPLPGWPDARVWFCGGFTGHGMSMAYRCARSCVEAMLDGAETPLPLSRLSPVRSP